MSDDYIFHAMAWHRLFALSRECPGLFSADELKFVASSALLATLAVPIKALGSETKRSDDGSDDDVEKQLRLASLVGAAKVPTRDDLVAALAQHAVVQHVAPELKDLHACMEEAFDPLHLCSKVAPMLAFVAAHESLAHYVRPLESTALMRLVKQVCAWFVFVFFPRR